MTYKSEDEVFIPKGASVRDEDFKKSYIVGKLKRAYPEYEISKTVVTRFFEWKKKKGLTLKAIKAFDLFKDQDYYLKHSGHKVDTKD